MSDDGSASAELVFLTPVLVLVGLAAMVLGGLVLDKGQVVDTARSAAEAASVWPTPAEAHDAAVRTAAYDIVADGLVCRPARVALDTAGFVAGGSLQVTVTCPVAVPRFVPGLPPVITLIGTATAPIEPFREVG